MKRGNLPHEPHAKPVLRQLVRMERSAERPKLLSADTAAVVRYFQHRFVKERYPLLRQADFDGTALWIVTDGIID